MFKFFKLEIGIDDIWLWYLGSYRNELYIIEVYFLGWI